MGTPRRLRSLLVVAGMLVFAYLAVCALMFARQRDFIYLPAGTRIDAAATDFALENDGIVLRGWTVNPGRPRALLYFGGNAEAVRHNREAFAQWFPGHTVYLLAYRGYGASDGTPSEAALSTDALALYDHVRDRHEGIDAIGRSLGSGVAARLAAQRPLARLALVTPYDSMIGAAQHHYPWLPVRWLLHDRYDSATHLAGFEGRVLVLRAGRDRVIPAASTERLIASLPDATRIVVVPDAGHNDIELKPVYGESLSEFMAFETRQ